MVPFIGAITAGIGVLSSSIGGLFTGEKRAARKAKRQARRSARKQKKVQKRAPVTPLRVAAAGVLDPGRITPVTEGVPFIEKATLWFKGNWYIAVAGAAVIALLIFLVTKKKSNPGVRKRMAKARAAKKRKRNPSNPGSSSKAKKKSSGSFAARTRRVNREWKKAKAAGSKIGRKAAWAKWG